MGFAEDKRIPVAKFDKLLISDALYGPTRKFCEKILLKYKPTSKEPFMNAKQKEYFRQKLINWKETLLQESHQTISNLKEVKEVTGDFADIASAETLSSDFYTNKEIFESSKEAIFANSWQLITDTKNLQKNNLIYIFIFFRRFYQNRASRRLEGLWPVLTYAGDFPPYPL